MTVSIGFDDSAKAVARLRTDQSNIVSILSSGTIIIKTSVIDINIICGDGMIIVNTDGVVILSEKCRYESDAEREEPSHKERRFGIFVSFPVEYCRNIKAARTKAVKNLSDRSASD